MIEVLRKVLQEYGLDVHMGLWYLGLQGFKKVNGLKLA
jgi:hypothetical protein